MIFTFRDGKVIEKERFLEFCQKASWKYTIKEYKKDRTSEQNRYYWLLLWIVQEETGTDKDDIHAMMGQKFLLCKEKKIPFVRSTTKLTTKQFSDYIENIKDFFSKYWIMLPEAKDVL
jgi:hypothetical protein